VFLCSSIYCEKVFRELLPEFPSLLGSYQEIEKVYFRLMSSGTVKSEALRDLLVEESVSFVNVEKCKVIDSKKAPLWIVRKDVNAAFLVWVLLHFCSKDITRFILRNFVWVELDNVFILRCDDRVENEIWMQCFVRRMGELLEEEAAQAMIQLYDVHLMQGKEDSLMSCVDVVPECMTLAEICRGIGGWSPKRFFRQDWLLDYFSCLNEAGTGWDTLMANYTSSLAGSCALEYIFGLGGRHNDNLLVKSDGTIFHIDYTQGFGRYKTKFGIKRERPPFILSPPMVYVMKHAPGDACWYDLFVDAFVEAMTVLTRHKLELIGLEAVVDPEYGEYSYVGCSLDNLENVSIRAWCLELISSSLSYKTTMLGDVVHIIAHK
jgi:phosphatidylinositol-4,5-bisphosphate 3-kinase